MHNFTRQFEAMMLALVLIGFGALLGDGILASLRWTEVAVALAIVFVIRPVAGLIELLGSPVDRWERGAIAFFGIRGMGSIYYLSYAFNEGDFAGSSMKTLWAVTSLTVVVSIAVHGLTATPFMSLLDERLRGRANVPGHDAAAAVTNSPRQTH